MSWGEVFKINSNMKKPLNEQLRDMKFQPIRVITSTGTYIPEKTGIYKIICIGSGGDGAYAQTGSNLGSSGGGGGGVAIKVMKLTSSVSYSVTVSTTASFAYSGGAITATSGGAAFSGKSAGVGGTASGGDYNYVGEAGSSSSSFNTGVRAGSVGVVLTDLTRSHYRTNALRNGTATTYLVCDGILNYGGGGTVLVDSYNSTYVANTVAPLPAAILIIPLEMEE